MMNPGDDTLARQACLTCRKQKRKCTRELPACELCRKSRRPCDYQAGALSATYASPLSPPVSLLPIRQL